MEILAREEGRNLQALKRSALVEFPFNGCQKSGSQYVDVDNAEIVHGCISGVCLSEAIDKKVFPIV